MLNLANKITLLRILMTPLVVLLLYFEGPVACILATLAFIFASLTDWADGYIARRSNMVTSMGKFLDPLADKVLICSVLIMFVKLGWAWRCGCCASRACLRRWTCGSGWSGRTRPRWPPSRAWACRRR